ncbi:hypothetical protein TSUD_74770 [Trifolium subterraneum]|nr:hypothetical protein TSUD_74770 [Trifolium subterraneum]
MKETNSDRSLRQLHAKGTVNATIEEIKQTITAKRIIVLDGANGGNKIASDRRSRYIGDVIDIINGLRTIGTFPIKDSSSNKRKTWNVPWSYACSANKSFSFKRLLFANHANTFWVTGKFCHLGFWVWREGIAAF